MSQHNHDKSQTGLNDALLYEQFMMIGLVKSGAK